MPKRFFLHLPSPLQDLETNLIEHDGVVVILGANGSGKTRLGEWIEAKSPESGVVHRISAQKSLKMPKSVSSISVDQARSELLYGTNRLITTTPQLSHRPSFRWKSDPIVNPLNDYENLVVFLFSEEAEVSTKYRQAAVKCLERIEPPITKLDTVVRIWQSLLPHRELMFGGGKIEARAHDGQRNIYNGAQMSDGERVIFYLIAQCLSAPRDGLIVLDEPEIHLHKSLQAALWDAIEAERPDCQFVYITHDLDFAMTRIGATKVYLRSFDGEFWDWYVAPESENIPEEILLKILGGRKPVLFVEGNEGSLDQFILWRLFPTRSVVPLASCHHVIHATTSFRALKGLHTLECHGIIDRDYRTDEDIENLRRMNVFCLEVAEIENLLLLEGVLQSVANLLLRDDFPHLMERVREKVFAQLTHEKVKVASAITATAMEKSLGSLNSKAQGSEGLSLALNALVSQINVDALYEKAITQIEQILKDGDYEAAIKLYTNKGLLPQVSPIFGLQPHEMLSLIKRLLNSPEGETALKIMRGAVPSLSIK